MSEMEIKKLQAYGALVFAAAGNEVVRFYSDGRVEINPAYTTTEAATEFWRIVTKLAKGEM